MLVALISVVIAFVYYKIGYMAGYADGKDGKH